MTNTIAAFWDKYAAAKNASSLPGELCKFTGCMGVLAGGVLIAGSIATGSGGALALSGGITVAGALAGAPIAALGSIATQAKKNAKFAELEAYINILERESAVESSIDG